MDTEISFPRGGFKPTKSNEFKSKEEVNGQTRKRKRSQSTSSDDRKKISLVSAESLSYAKLQEGMLVLGCVSQITSLFLEVELPGRVFGKVDVRDLSAPYVDLLKQSLQNNNVNQLKDLHMLNRMYFIGQILPTKVISIKRGLETEVSLSIDPADINIDLSTSSYKVGKLTWAAVWAKHDHGYLLFVGNENCRVFLPFKNIKNGQSYEIGETLWCVVQQSNISSGMAVVVVSSIAEDILKVTEDKLNLQSVIPGTQFDFTITKILGNDLQGTICNGTTAYVNKMFLSKPFFNKKWQVGSTYKARLLYCESLTKICFLSLRPIDVHVTPTYSVGTSINAQVVFKDGSGVYVKCPNDELGFISNKRILKALTVESKENPQTYLKKKFHLDSTYRTKILCYNSFEQCYICCFENISANNLFTKNDFHVGQQVKATVKEHNDVGLVVKIGQLTGLIQNIHISNTKYSENIKSKIKVNHTLNVKVWNINDQGIFFTNKQSLVNSDSYLESYESAVIYNQYLGFVANITKSGDILVIFYNDLRGIIKNCPSDAFFKGQVILTTVMGKTSEGLILSLEPPDLLKLMNENTSDEGTLSTEISYKKKNKVIDVGEFTNVIVTEIKDDSLVVLTNNKIRARVPASHLTCNLSLNSMLLGTYNVGDELQNVICIDYRILPILSLREAKHYNDIAFSDLKEGDIVRGSYHSSSNMTVSVSIPFKGVNKIIKLPLKDFTVSKKKEKLNFKHQQPILLKVMNVSEENNSINATGIVSELMDPVEYQTKPLEYLESYLKNVTKLCNNSHQINQSLSKLHIGECVECVVTKVAESGCLVTINNTDAQGLASIELCPGGIQVGQKLEGVVLWIDYVDNCAYVALEQKFVQKISAVQEQNIAKSLIKLSSKAKVLLVKDDFVLVVLKGPKVDGQLAFLPTFIHENLFTYMDGYSILEVIKVKIFRSFENFIMCLDQGCERSIKKFLSKKIKNNNITAKECIKSEITTDLNDSGCMGSISEDNNVANNHEKNVKRKNIKKVQAESVETPNSDFALDLSLPTSQTDSGFSCMSNFFSSETSQEINNDYTSDNDDHQKTTMKRKKISTSEKAELLKQTEEQIWKLELENASLKDPQNSDQFERLLLGNPNCSELWIKYIAFHIIGTEFNKARTIALRALKIIDLNESLERYNIWVARLHLENDHGQKSSFAEVFEEAVRCNDSLDIYLEVIKMLGISQKFEEMEEKIRKAKLKFKQDLKMWVTISEVYFKNKMDTKARNFRDLALRSLGKNQQSLTLLVHFALLEFRFGHVNEAESLFETILQNNPKKSNIWCTYVDQVIKIGDTDKVRRIFDRAISQDMGIKKKKSLFKKYENFEITYGTKETLQTLLMTIGKTYS